MEVILDVLVGRQLIGEQDTFLWFSRVATKAETASLIITAQARALQTE
jgi:hypothetical protein